MKYRNIYKKGQALTEFVLIAPLLIIICLAIIQFMNWTRVTIEAQNGAWYAIRSQTPDWYTGLSFPVSNTQLADSLNSSIFAFYTTDQVSNVDLSPPDMNALNLGLFFLSALNPLDVSMVRHSTVTARTHFLPEAAPFPAVNNIFGQQIVTLNGQRYLVATAQSSIFASWTSFVEDPSFSVNEAVNNLNAMKECANLQEELANVNKAVRVYQKLLAFDEQEENDNPNNSYWEQQTADANNNLVNEENAQNQLSYELGEIGCNDSH